MEKTSPESFASGSLNLRVAVSQIGMITIFTPSFADESDTNAQNLSVKEIVARLDPERFRVTMFYESAPDPRIAKRPNTRLLRWRKHGNTVFTIGRFLADIPDVYFFPREGPLDAAFLKLRRLLRLRTALVTLVVSGGLDVQPYGEARTNNIREADCLLANNTYLGQLLREKMGVEAATIYDGVDRRNFFPPGERRENQTISVLYAGSMRPYKCVPMVVQQAVRWPGVQFRIAGTGEEEQLCRTVAKDLNCHNVEFLGHLPAAKVGEEMRNADIFLFPSKVEGHPQVLVQAAASGLPSIARRSYRPDYVVDGTTGFLVDTDSEMAEKLDLLIREPEKRHVMSAAAVRHAAKFSWERIALEFQEVFELAVRKRSNH